MNWKMRKAQHSLRGLLVAAAAAMVCVATLEAQQVRHPLDPLTWQEHWTILEVLRVAGH